jgi:hypothetical protein
LQHRDPPFEQSLFLARGLIINVLGHVALAQDGVTDSLRDLLTASGCEVLELLAKTGKSGTRDQRLGQFVASLVGLQPTALCSSDVLSSRLTSVCLASRWARRSSRESAAAVSDGPDAERPFGGGEEIGRDRHLV